MAARNISDINIQKWLPTFFKGSVSWTHDFTDATFTIYKSFLIAVHSTKDTPFRLF